MNFLHQLYFSASENLLDFIFSVVHIYVEYLILSGSFLYFCLLIFLFSSCSLNTLGGLFWIIFQSVVIGAFKIFFGGIVCPWFLLIFLSLSNGCMFVELVISSRVYKFALAEEDHHQSAQAGFLGRLVSSVHGYSWLAVWGLWLDRVTAYTPKSVWVWRRVV